MGVSTYLAPPPAPSGSVVAGSDGIAVMAVVAVVQRWTATFDASALSATGAQRVVRQAAAMRNMIALVESAAGDRVAETAAWKSEGATSAEAWLASVSGISEGQARESLATAARLQQLPEISAAARRGELSRQQVAAISDAATAAPDREAELLELARRESLGQLRRSCLRFKAAADHDPEATYRRQRAARRLSRRVDAEGMWNLWARSTADDGARLNNVLDPIIDRIFQEARRAGTEESREAYALDAFMELATGAARDPALPVPRSSASSLRVPRSSASSVSGTSGGSAQPAAGRQLVAFGDAAGTDAHAVPEAPAPIPHPMPDPTTGRPGRTPVAFQAILRADLSALTRGRVEGDEVCEIDGLGPIPVCRARELLGEAVLTLVITKGVEVRSVTHLGRGPKAAQKIALLWEQPVCQVRGCGRRCGLEFDHNVRWADRQVTEIDNLDRLCSKHHALKSTQNWALIRGAGIRPMVPPSHPDHPG